MNISKLWNNAKLRFGIKAGLAYGSVYYIAEQGVWRSSEEVVQLCNNISENVGPYTEELTKHVPFELPNLPQTNKVLYLMNYYWNRGVLTSYEFLADLPGNVSRWIDKEIEYIAENKELKKVFNSENKESTSTSLALKD